MSGHTPGRLRIGAPPPNGEQTIGTESGLMIAVATTGINHPTEANARRLVACWNALDGIPTTEIESSAQSSSISYALAKVISQRDELLAALKAICNEQDERQGYASCEAYDKARAAIAKITGESNA